MRRRRLRLRRTDDALRSDVRQRGDGPGALRLVRQRMRGRAHVHRRLVRLRDGADLLRASGGDGRRLHRHLDGIRPTAGPATRRARPASPASQEPAVVRRGTRIAAEPSGASMRAPTRSTVARARTSAVAASHAWPGRAPVRPDRRIACRPAARRAPARTRRRTRPTAAAATSLAPTASRASAARVPARRARPTAAPASAASTSAPTRRTAVPRVQARSAALRSHASTGAAAVSTRLTRTAGRPTAA